MSKAKRFRVPLDKAPNSEATSIIIPFNVEKTFGSRGRVPVRGTVNGFEFRGSAFPLGDGRHYMVVNKAVREGAKIQAGETVNFVMEMDDAPRVVVPPEDFARALKQNKIAQKAWASLSYSHQKEHVNAIEDAKKEETRLRRIEKAVANLEARGQKI